MVISFRFTFALKAIFISCFGIIYITIGFIEMTTLSEIMTSHNHVDMVSDSFF